MTQYRRQGPRWYNIWLPLLLLMLGGLLVLEPQGSLSPAGHPITQIVLALLMYGVVAIWLWCNRRAVLNQAYEHAQAQEHRHAAGQQQRDGGMSDHEPWEEVGPPWQSNGHYTDMQRRR
jgi:ABC-type nickel/cobalt efflux system permease component RcnA